MATWECSVRASDAMVDSVHMALLRNGRHPTRPLNLDPMRLTLGLKMLFVRAFLNLCRPLQIRTSSSSRTFLMCSTTSCAASTSCT